ncbi:MAG: hypothetical protein KF745_14835 [Phycisphaeraceae bacterium]|nr:hypothetical protein [Phycisphaeraceae bacterium]
MIILNPSSVTFAGRTLADTDAVLLDRTATRLAEEWSDSGPYCVLADVPEQRVQIRIVRRILRDDLAPPIPGEQGALSLVTSPNASDASRRRLAATAVVTAVSHQVSAKAATQTITLLVLSATGAADPVSISAAPALP